MAEEIVAIIQKIRFGNETDVYSDNYLDEYKQRDRWNTRRPYKAVEGKRFKLILYDTNQKQLTAEVDIESVAQTNEQPDFPWSNFYAPGSWREYNPPIEIVRVHSVPGLENFGTERAAYRNITHSQYDSLSGTLTDAIKAAREFRAGGETDAHKRLKEYVCKNPQIVGLDADFVGETECPLPSGDCLDVSFATRALWVAVEVKSAASPEADIGRGIFQCVKYIAVMNAVLIAESRPPDARVALVVEGKLSPRMAGLKNRLGVNVIEGVSPHS